MVHLDKPIQLPHSDTKNYQQDHEVERTYTLINHISTKLYREESKVRKISTGLNCICVITVLISFFTLYFSIIGVPIVLFGYKFIKSMKSSNKFIKLELEDYQERLTNLLEPQMQITFDERLKQLTNGKTK